MIWLRDYIVVDWLVFIYIYIYACMYVCPHCDRIAMYIIQYIYIGSSSLIIHIYNEQKWIIRVQIGYLNNRWWLQNIYFRICGFFSGTSKIVPYPVVKECLNVSCDTGPERSLRRHRFFVTEEVNLHFLVGGLDHFLFSHILGC